MRLARTALSLWTAALLAGFGCGPGPDEASGGDDKRQTAAQVPFDQVVDDRVSPDDGDATDWRVIRLQDPDKLNVAIYWDSVNVGARIALLNAFGNTVAKREHAEGEAVDRISADLEKGEYYLMIAAEEGSSVYSLEITTGEPQAPGARPKARYTDPRPE